MGQVQINVPRQDSKKESDQKARATDSRLRWSIALASGIEGAGADNPPSVLPATISPQFTKILEDTSVASAQRDLQELVLTALHKAAGSVHCLDNSITFQPSVINSAFVTCMRGYHVATTPVQYGLEAFRSMLSVLCFLTPNTDAVVFKEMVKDGQRKRRQDFADADSKSADATRARSRE